MISRKIEKGVIKFIIIDDWNDFVCKISTLTYKKPKYFRFIYVGTTDYVVAYSNKKFSSREAIKKYEQRR